MRSPRKLSVALLATGLTVAAVACGSRSGLLADGPWDPDVEEDAADDPVRRMDARARDVEVPLPGLDARPDVIVDQRDCRDPSETLVYLMGSDNNLYAFDPRDYGHRLVGPILCPTEGSGSPFSMAVDRQGVAYVVFQDPRSGIDDGKLFRVSTRTAACAETGFAAGQEAVSTFGMGFASDTGGPAETLFIAPTENFGPGTLGRIGLPSLQLEVIAPFQPEIIGAELTGTGDGRLFAFYRKELSGSGSFIGQVDKSTGEIIGELALPGVSQSFGWAFAFWGGDFFTFTGISSGQSTVTRVRPSDGTVVEVAQIPSNIVGAGVSTCSPVE